MKYLQLGKFENVTDIHIFAGSFLHHQDVFFEQNLDCYWPIPLTRKERLNIHYTAIAVVQKYLPFLQEYLNKKNNLNYSLTFWHTFLSFWLACLIPNVLEKYFKIKYFIQNVPFPLRVSLIEPESVPYFKDDFNFNNCVFSDHIFNHYLSSLVIEIQKESLKRSGWVLEYKKTQLAFNHENQSLLFSPPKGCFDHITGLNNFETSILNFISRCRKGNFPPVSTSNNYLANNAQIPPLPWEKILTELCPQTYLNISSTLNKIPPLMKRKFYIFSGIHSSIQKRVAVSLVRENGVPIYISQHGSSYGEPLCATLPFICQYTLDGFISWGWTKHKHHNANIIPLPSPILSKMKFRRLFSKKTKIKKIVFISSVYTANAGAGVSLDTDHLKETYDKLFIFLNELSSEVWQSFYYRPRPSHLNSRFNFFPILQKKFPHLKELKGSFGPKIADADLVVQFHDSSTLNKVIAAKIPTIVLSSKNHLPLNDYIESHQTFAESHNLSFSDPQKAAYYINRIYKNLRNELKDNPKYWAFYRNRYCRGSFFYFFHWLRLIFKL